MKLSEYEMRKELVRLETERRLAERKAETPAPVPRFDFPNVDGGFATRLGAIASALTGPVGPQGERGIQGELGPVGPQGAPGLDGRAGVDGKDGKDGRDGVDGLYGRDGAEGPQGPVGPQGPKGDAGDGFTWRDSYTSGTRYLPNDVVSYRGSSWIAKFETISPPATGSLDWGLVAAKGDDGASGLGNSGVEGELAAYLKITDAQTTYLSIDDADADFLTQVDAASEYLTQASAATTYPNVTLAAVGSSPAATGASLSGQTLTLQPASATQPGVVTAGTQTIGGDKTFSGAIAASNLTNTNSGDITLGNVGSSPASTGASLSGQVLTLQPASGSQPGVMTAGTQTIGGDKTFSGAISASNLSNTNSGDITLATVGSSPAAAGASLSGQVLTLQPADATRAGVLSITTQTIAGAKTFNNTVTSGVASGANAFVTPRGARYADSDGQYIQPGQFGWSSSLGYLIIGGCQIGAASGQINASSSNNNMKLIGNANDGATARGTVLDNLVTLSTAGAGITSFRNNTTEKSFVDKDGNYEVLPSGGAVILKSPNGTRYSLTISNAGAATVTAL